MIIYLKDDKKIKNCNCGCNKYKIVRDTESKETYIFCDNCNNCSNGWTKEQAIARWNKKNNL